jgi:peptidoglycan/LPS O-acetylase OafA/YrhL
MQNRYESYYGTLDGLRAISVIAVLLFHSDIGWLKGGFLGVETFFVISGFIITHLMQREFYNTSGIDIFSFYKRRLKRLLPDMLVMIFVAMCVVLIKYPEEIKKCVEDIIPALTYSLNWYYIFKDMSYFEIFGRPRIFEHMWSLSVEFQFYIIWPFIGRFIFKRSWTKAFWIIWAGMIICSSEMSYLYNQGIDISRLYFGLDTRAGGFFMGSALAITFPKLKVIFTNSPSVSSAFGLFSLIGLVFSYIFLDEKSDFLYQGGFMVVGFLSATCIGATLINKNSLISRFLGSNIMSGIGKRAYNIYLWHWPVFVLTQPGIDVNFDGILLFIFRIFITLSLSEISYRYIYLSLNNGKIRYLLNVYQNSQEKFYIKATATVSIIGIIGSMSLGVYARWSYISDNAYTTVAEQQRKLIETEYDEAIKLEVQIADKKNMHISINEYPMIIYDMKIIDFGNLYPRLISDRTYVPVRIFQDYMGYSTKWYAENYNLEITKDGKTIIADYINKTLKLSNGDLIKEQDIQIYQNSAYLPLKYLINEFGYFASFKKISPNYSVLRIVKGNSSDTSIEEVLSALEQEKNKYFDNLAKYLEENYNALQVNFSTDKIMLNKWEEIGTRLKISSPYLMNQNLKVYWSQDTNGKHNWETVPYTIYMPCPYWYSWDEGEYTVSAKVDNGQIEKVITIVIKVISPKVNNQNEITKTYDWYYNQKGQIDGIHPAIKKKRPYLAVGDSVMLGASKKIYSVFGDKINLDARGNRQLYQGMEILQEYKNNEILGEVVIIHLGTNAGLKKLELRNTLEFLKGCKKVLIFNLKLPYAYGKESNLVLEELVGEYENVKIINWFENSYKNPANFASDGIHLSFAGVELYTNLLIKYISMED